MCLDVLFFFSFFMTCSCPTGSSATIVRALDAPKKQNTCSLTMQVNRETFQDMLDAFFKDRLAMELLARTEMAHAWQPWTLFWEAHASTKGNLFRFRFFAPTLTAAWHLPYDAREVLHVLQSMTSARVRGPQRVGRELVEAFL